MGQIIIYHPYKDTKNLEFPATSGAPDARRNGMRMAGDLIESNYTKKSYRKAVIKALKDMIKNAPADREFDVRFEYTGTDMVPRSLRLGERSDGEYPLYCYTDKQFTSKVASLELDIQNDREKDSGNTFHMRITGPRRFLINDNTLFLYLQDSAADLSALTTVQEQADYLVSMLTFQRCL